MSSSNENERLMSVNNSAYQSFLGFTTVYEQGCHRITMKTQTTQTNSTSTWDTMVHAPFKKVVKFDLICMGLGVVMGMGIGAFLVTGA